MKKDKKGRIKHLGKKDKPTSGHSLCNDCGKDMPICWDTVCLKCRGTFCYSCSVSDGNFWYCKRNKLESCLFWQVLHGLIESQMFALLKSLFKTFHSGATFYPHSARV